MANRRSGPTAVAAAFALVMVGSVACLLLVLGLSTTWVILIQVAMFLPAGVWLELFTPRLAWRPWVESVTADGYCPSCGYFLADLPFDPDGLKTCAECGSAWKIDVPGAVVRRFAVPRR